MPKSSRIVANKGAAPSGKVRDGLTMAFIGVRGHGKSTSVVKLLAKSPFPNRLVFKEGVNVTDPAFRGWKVVPFEKFAGGNAIIDGGEIDYRQFIKLCTTKLFNATLVIDDAGIYESNDISPELKKLLINCRRQKVDVILVFHGLSDMPIRLWSYLNWVVLHHTTDNFKYKASKVPNGEMLLAAQKRIAAQVIKGGKHKYTVEQIKLS